MLKRGADPQQKHPSGADALVLLLDSPKCSLECAGILLAAMDSTPEKVSTIPDTTLFGAADYSPAQEKKLLAALADPRIDADRKIEIKCELIFAKRRYAGEFSFPVMLQREAKAYQNALEPIAMSINARTAEKVLAQVSEAAQRMAHESGDQWKMDMVDLCKQVWDA